MVGRLGEICLCLRLLRVLKYSELCGQGCIPDLAVLDGAGLMVGNLAPEVPSWCEPEWRGLMEACWEPNPSSRPSFRDLAAQLEKIIEAAPCSHSIL